MIPRVAMMMSQVSERKRRVGVVGLGWEPVVARPDSRLELIHGSNLNHQDMERRFWAVFPFACNMFEVTHSLFFDNHSHLS